VAADTTIRAIDPIAVEVQFISDFRSSKTNDIRWLLRWLCKKRWKQWNLRKIEITERSIRKLRIQSRRAGIEEI
jgi:hypothetical protein